LQVCNVLETVVPNGRADRQPSGDIKTFENFIVSVPDGIDINRYNTVIVWCESFGEFITAASYK
jgi:hypothetical protein